MKKSPPKNDDYNNLKKTPEDKNTQNRAAA